jgi:hypothetical protein
LDCPKCYSENFVGFPPVTVKKEVIKIEKQNESDVVESEEDEKIED